MVCSTTEMNSCTRNGFSTQGAPVRRSGIICVKETDPEGIPVTIANTVIAKTETMVHSHRVPREPKENGLDDCKAWKNLLDTSAPPATRPPLCRWGQWQCNGRVGAQ